MMLIFDNFFESFLLDKIYLVNFLINLPCNTIIFYLLEIYPEIILLFFLLFNLINVEKRSHLCLLYYNRWFCYFIIILACLVLELYFFSNYYKLSTLHINTQFIFSYYTQISKIIILILTISIVWMSKHQLVIETRLQLIPELLIIIGFSVLFLLLLTSTNDFFGFYLILEGLSLTLYILAGMLHSSLLSIESSMKYFVLGGVSSGIFLFGISLLFGIVGSLNFLELQLFFNNCLDISELKIILCFIFFGFFFKLAAFPCHWWIADVYEGIWTPITAFFAIVVKVSLLLFFFRLLYTTFSFILMSFQSILLFVTCGSLFIGTFGSLKQVRVKRFIAYASISQVGFIFMGLSCCSMNGLISSILYLFLYAIMSLIFFSLILKTEHILLGKNITFFSDLYSFDFYNKKEITFLSIVLLSMAGIPPLGGFIGKLCLYFASFDAKLDWIVFYSLLLSLISSYYYLNFVHYVWFVKHSYIRMYYFRVYTVFDLVIFILVGGLLLFFFFFLLF